MTQLSAVPAKSIRRVGRVLACAAAIAFGVFMIIYGGIDDSPGGQLLGLLAVVAGVTGLVKMRMYIR